MLTLASNCVRCDPTEYFRFLLLVDKGVRTTVHLPHCHLSVTDTYKNLAEGGQFSSGDGSVLPWMLLFFDSQDV